MVIITIVQEKEIAVGMDARAPMEFAAQTVMAIYFRVELTADAAETRAWTTEACVAIVFLTGIGPL
jgi:hypothetical protein